jgi:hypothetical protein
MSGGNSKKETYTKTFMELNALGRRTMELTETNDGGQL